MNKYMKSLAVGLLAGASVLTTSCDLDYKPIDTYSATNFWKSQPEYQIFFKALAQQFRASNATNVLFYAGEIRSGNFELSTVDASGTLNVEYIQNQYAQSKAQFSNFGGYYGYIANINEFIYQCENDFNKVFDTGNASDASLKAGLLGMAYGYRAFAYFQMYRMYGGVPLRLEPDVILGQYDATKLYKARSSAEETLTQIKKDIATSLENFSKNNYVYDSANKDYYWTKAATEMLAGEVYLWSGKVETGDHKANAADVATAATYFDHVINNYGYKLMDDFLSIWTTPHNSESIYSVCYTSENDGVYYDLAKQLMWARTTGAAYQNYWSDMGKDGWSHVKGQVNLFGTWTDAAGNNAKNDIWDTSNFGPNRYTYNNAIYYQYSDEDTRRDAFYPLWYISDADYYGKVKHLDNFDPKEGNYEDLDNTRWLKGTFFCKTRPTIPSGSTYLSFLNDMPIYRLAMAYLYAAECANYAGDNDKVEKYINAVRQRAYAGNWDVTKYGYKAGGFKANETALMREWDKEFVGEGQRWWNLRRLTTVKGGTQKDHMVFQPEGCLGYGLDTAHNPWMTDINGKLVDTDVPVLNGTTQDEHLLLWPLDQTLLSSDPELASQQNPGY